MVKYHWDTAMPWTYEHWFHEPKVAEDYGLVAAAEAYIAARALDQHPYFHLAAQSVDALKLWVTQELIMTGPFSQIVLRAPSVFENVHLRPMIMEVARGEHGPVRGHLAPTAHPWLLHRLRDSMGIPEEEVWPFEETQEFLEGLREE